MHELKKARFAKEHPDVSLIVRALPSEEQEELHRKLADSFGISRNSSTVELFRMMSALRVLIPDLDTEAEDFDLCGTLQSRGIVFRPTVYVNWSDPADMDEVVLVEFCKYFHEVWYPGREDIEIFDEDMCWLISVAHWGRLGVVNLKPAPNDQDR